jgi:large subunit ribosomal protein L17
MRHQTKKNTLGKAQDQRKALLRSLATELFVHGEITTTLARAKALKPYAEKIITLAKKGDLNSIRNAAKYIYNKETGDFMAYDVKKKAYVEVPADGKFTDEVKKTPQTVLRKLFVVIGKKYADQKADIQEFTTCLRAEVTLLKWH